MTVVAPDPMVLDPRLRTMCVMVGPTDGNSTSLLDHSEVVLEVLARFTPTIEIIEPGRYLIPTLGPARYHGGEDALAKQVYDGVVRALDAAGSDPVSGRGPSVVVSVAGGPRMAVLVALGLMGAPGSDLSSRAVLVLDDGADASHIATMSIRRLEHLVTPETLDLFIRLGLTSIGRFADLEVSDVRARFGPEVAEVHRMVNGSEREPSRPHGPDEYLGATEDLEPPLSTVDQIAFVARSMSHDLMERLSSRSLGADAVRIVADTDTDVSIDRVWRVEGGLSVPVITQRVRWQIEGWLRSVRRVAGRSSTDTAGDVGSVSSLCIEPVDVRPYRGTQIGFWGEVDDHDRLVMGGIDRMRGLFGIDAVRVPRPVGGRSPRQSHRLVDIDGNHEVVAPTEPWPGSIPRPHPARVWDRPIPAEVVDAQGKRVGVSGRGVISSPPERLSVEGGPWSRITGWAGPWCVDERWWDPLGHRRKARIQVLVEPVGDPRGTRSTQAHLLTLEVGTWWVEATYD